MGGFSEQTLRDLAAMLAPHRVREPLALLLAEASEGLGDGMLLASGSGTPLWWNSAFLALTGITASDLIGHGVVPSLADRSGDSEQAEARLAELEAARVTAPPERLRLRSGRTVEVCTRARRADGAVAARSWTIRDLTTADEREREIARLAALLEQHDSAIDELVAEKAAASAAIAEKIRMLGALAHEVRSPMNALLGAAGILRETSPTDEQLEMLALIERAGNRVLAVVRGVLDLATLQSGRRDRVPTEFDLIDVVESTLRSASAGSADGVEVESRIAADVPRRVTGDPDGLDQVLQNLIGNALKFTDAGAVTVAVSPDPGEGRDSWIRIEVADTGPGIEPERLEAIFRPFGPGGAPRDRHGGNGLGLSIAKEIVERDGGSIAVESTPGRGSRFTVRLPLPAVPDQPRPSRLPTRKTSILIADSCERSRRTVAETVRSWGGDVVEAVDAASVISRIAHRGPEIGVLVLDLRVAGGDDFALLRHLSELGDLLDRTLVVLPIRHRRDDLHRLRELGASSSLHRPIRRRELHERLSKMLERLPP